MNIKSPLSPDSKAMLIEKIPTDIIKERYYRLYEINVGFNIPYVLKYRCEESGYEFFYPFDLGGDSSFYEQLQRIDWYYMPWKWEHGKAVEHVGKNDKVLEVGSGNSSFVEHLTKKGLQATGLELNEAAVQSAQERGLNVLKENIENHSKKNLGQYDLVCSFQVLEHISDIYPFIAGMIKCLKPGGTLIICVPNNDSFIKKAEWNILNMPPHHMGLWSKKSLGYLSEIFPLKNSKFLYEPLQSYHYSWYQGIIESLIGKIPIIRNVYYHFSLSKIAGRLIPLISKSITGHSIMAIYKKE
ncbi:class I SAM-dependent methyltransferase [Rhodohalobacter sp. 8-1]|uniref:class I SAM-dependent methyltransferase n=1 Tax=Rhodohalobacter sp. 8-1 TaxID=3131972 RepID=UPI0030ED6F48